MAMKMAMAMALASSALAVMKQTSDLRRDGETSSMRQLNENEATPERDRERERVVREKRSV